MPEAVVRESYEALQSERAGRGTLVATPLYGRSAHDFEAPLEEPTDQSSTTHSSATTSSPTAPSTRDASGSAWVPTRRSIFTLRSGVWPTRCA